MNLTWLDLSFNSISKLEGLDKLTRLTDLSLFSNKLERIENIQTLEELVVLSLGMLTHVLCLKMPCQRLQKPKAFCHRSLRITVCSHWYNIIYMCIEAGLLNEDF